MNRIGPARARELAYMRRTKSGGKAPSCLCGKCKTCKKRAEIAKYRKGLKKRESD